MRGSIWRLHRYRSTLRLAAHGVSRLRYLVPLALSCPACAILSRLRYLAAATVLLASVSVAVQPAPKFLLLYGSSKVRRELVLAPVIRKPVAVSISATAIVEADGSAVEQFTSQIPARVVRLVAELGQNVRRAHPS
jgi:hypothetical protein